MKQNPIASNTCQAKLVAALLNPRRYPHPATSVERLETHISHILLAGDYAYKIKKPLNLGFLDFTSLARRQYYCAEEVRLNRRLAPDLYLDCIPICGSAENPVLGGDPATAIEYAVKMARFPQAALLDRCLDELSSQPAYIDTLARQLAQFHGTIDRTGADKPFGLPERIQHLALENFKQSRVLLNTAQDLEKLTSLERWTSATYHRLQGVMTARQTEGFIRECHGDLHLGNMILRNGQITIFDCIEFNDDLRWIDVMSDLAFLYMDLCRFNVPRLAQRLLNTYLEFSGDYPGLAVLPYYLVYRAVVRAKIAAIRLGQGDLDATQRQRIQEECRGYLDLALAFTQRPTPFLLITHGVSGSGKSYVTSQLLEVLDAIRIRSDVERKRLYGLGPLDTSNSVLNQGLYTAEAGERTYARLQTLAGQILDAGYPVLVDATFLKAEQRQAFRALASAKAVPFVLLACRAEPEYLRARLAQRRGHDAAEADITVLEQQLQHYTPPAAWEDPLDAGMGDRAVLHAAIMARVQASTPSSPIGSKTERQERTPSILDHTLSKNE